MNTAEREAQAAEQPQAQEMPEVASEPTVGEQLVAARQAQNLSVTDVANRLKLSVHQVTALEEGHYDRLPGPVFVRGFTRNYARLLKLDPEALVHAVDGQLPRATPEQAAPSGEANIPMPAKSGRYWPVLAGIAAAVFLGAALIDVLWPETPASAPAVKETAVAVPASPAAAGAPEAQAPTVTVEASSSAPAESTAAAAPSTPEPTATGAAVPPATSPSGSTSSGRALRFVFDQPSWVQVKDGSGTVVLEALYAAGTSRELTAAPPLTLVIGNAAGVHLTYGDRAVDLAPHTRVAVARLTLE